MSERAERDDETSPFPLEREKEEKEPQKDETSPFPLERERETAKSEPEGVLPVRSVEFDTGVRRARRSLVVALGVHALALVAFASIALARWAKGVASPPELVVMVISAGIAVVHLRASGRLSRLGRNAAHDGAILASSLASLRAVLVLKALLLFGSLALLCFVLSTVVSLIASI